MPYSAPDSRPYDAGAYDTSPETLPLDAVVRMAIDCHLLDVRTAMPAQISRVLSNQQVDVQPMIQARYQSQDEPVTLPIIQSIPVVMASGKNYALKVPVAVGDTGLLIFCDRSIDVWCVSNAEGPVDPQDTRHHDLSDAVFVPGLVPFALQTDDATDDLVMRCGKAEIRLQQDGRVRAGGVGSGQDLLDLVHQLIESHQRLIDVLTSETFTLTQMGAQPFIATTSAALSRVKTEAQNIQSKLETLETGNA